MSIARQLGILGGPAVLVIVGWFGSATLFGREGRETAAEGPGASPPPPPPVVVQEVRFASDAAVLTAVGTGVARVAVELYPEAAGRVTEILFQAGEEVEAGDPLLRLDAEEERLAVELARVQIDGARQRLERYERAEPSGAVSASKVDAARTGLSAARVQLAQAELALRQRTLMAPFAGVTGIPEVDVGGRITESTVIGTLDDRSSILVDFEVPEAFAYGARPGGELTLSTWARPGETFTGEVTSIGSRIDEVSRTLRVRATVANEDDRLRPGMSFSIRLPLAGDRFPSVPSIAVQWDREGAYVWRVVDGTAERVFASVLKRSEGWVLLDAPLEAGVIPLHDEDAIFAAEAAHLGEETRRRQTRLDWLAGLTAFKAVILEGLEVAFIVIAVGAGRGLLIPAGLGALAACVLVLAVGLLVHRPLSRVPENTLKFGVGVMLSAFGVFWTGEGLGVDWPGHDLALFVFAALFLGAGLLASALVRKPALEVAR